MAEIISTVGVIVGIIAAACAGLGGIIGFVWWLSAMYWQGRETKRVITDISGKLDTVIDDTKQEATRIWKATGENAKEIARVDKEVGILKERVNAA